MTIKSKFLPLILAAVAMLALPAAAQATLTYVKGTAKPVVYTAADNGKSPHRIGPGRSPKVSPDGNLVAYEYEGKNRELKLATADGSSVKTLLKNLRGGYSLVFSPDSTMLAALRGPELGKQKLVVIDLESGAVLTVAGGYFNGVSFSPESDELVYAKAGSENYPPRSDVYRYAIASGATKRLTKDHNSLDPLWGPTGKIVFVKQLGAKQRKYGPKNELYLMNPDGSGVKRLTHTNVGPLLQGLYPTEWSADGNRLLTEFGGQDTSYAVTVNPKTGAQRVVSTPNKYEFVGTALSADGTTILGFTGGFEPGPKHNVVSVPYTGGKPKTLVKQAFEPDWSR
jgi:Tol biopolymer transport system component